MFALTVGGLGRQFLGPESVEAAIKELHDGEIALCCGCGCTGDTESIECSVAVNCSEVELELAELGPIIVASELGVGGN